MRSKIHITGSVNTAELISGLVLCAKELKLAGYKPLCVNITAVWWGALSGGGTYLVHQISTRVGVSMVMIRAPFTGVSGFNGECNADVMLELTESTLK